MLKNYWYQLPPSVVQRDTEEATDSWVMRGVELGRYGFRSQLFPILSQWLKPSVFQIAASTTVLTLFLLRIKVEIGTIYLAEYTYCLTQQVSILFGASKHDCDANTVKGNRVFCIDSLIKIIQRFITRSLLTGTRSIIPDSEVLPCIIFAMVFASCFLCDDSGVSRISSPQPCKVPFQSRRLPRTLAVHCVTWCWSLRSAQGEEH